MTEILTPDLEREILRLQREVRIQQERAKLRIAEHHTYWKFDPIVPDPLARYGKPVSDSKQVGQAGGVPFSQGESASAKFYLWTLAMGVVLGLLAGFWIWR